MQGFILPELMERRWGDSALCPSLVVIGCPLCVRPDSQRTVFRAIEWLLTAASESPTTHGSLFILVIRDPPLSPGGSSEGHSWSTQWLAALLSLAWSVLVLAVACPTLGFLSCWVQKRSRIVLGPIMLLPSIQEQQRAGLSSRYLRGSTHILVPACD